MKKILGLDIGTNSIGWAFIQTNLYEEPDELQGHIVQLGSRIIPMDNDAMSKFESGNPESKAAGRRQARHARRLNQRYKLRRTRLIEALKILKWIPDDFPISFENLTHHNIKSFLPFSDAMKNEAAVFFGIVGKKTTKGIDYEIPEDWLIYFLKTKALREQVSLQEIARILYHYNQRRGFKSSRKDNKGDTDENTKKKQEEWVAIVKVIGLKEVGPGEGKFKDTIKYELECETSDLNFKTLIYRKNKPDDWLGKHKEFRITKRSTKDGTTTYNIYDLDPTAWENRKAALEKDINKEGKFISEYYLNNIQANRNYPIKQRIVDRTFYQDELKKIWEVQSAFYGNEFNDKIKIAEIADSFYVHNKQKNKELKAKDLFHIFYSDIIYYQRGLKSQKGLLANCTYEHKIYKAKNGEEKRAGIKVTSRSAPCFQEFRIWQTIHNLKLIKKEAIVDGKLKLNIDMTAELITEDIKEQLFELFDGAMEVSHDSILRMLGFKKDKIESGEKSFEYKLNYPDDRDFPGNETKSLFRKVFKKHGFEEQGGKYLNDPASFNHLWHIVYSLPEEDDIKNALRNKKYFDLPESIISHIAKLPEFKRLYAALSSKAISKFLPLMRVGKYWSPQFEPNVLNRVNKIIDGEFDPAISEKVREEVKKLGLDSILKFKGLPAYIAAYIVYGRHSERANEAKYETVDDLKINELIPYNSLRNPVVEKIVREALSLVKDVWKDKNLGRPDYIHVELGREMKNSNKDREQIYNVNNRNRLERLRVAALIGELKYPLFNENSISDLDKFRIWKENGGKEGDDLFQELFKDNKAEFVKDADIEKYRRWAEQNYRSPYSGSPIPLSELFTEKYQIDHIIPRSRFYDDSASNKVVVEARLNDLKGNRLAMQFIEDSQGRDFGVQSLSDYLKFIDTVFTSRKKRRHLKLYEVPDDFVERQMNDTKYISRTVAQLLRPIAIGSETDNGIVYTSGNITSDLKAKWGLHTLWKDILKPRFERLEQLTGEQLIFSEESNQERYRFAKDYKRIDHRHHALDALVVACTSRSHIKYLNSLNSLSNNRKDIAKYEEWRKWKYLLNKKKQLENKENGMTEFSLPWDNFYLEVKEAIQSIIVSHKPSSKLISKAINKYYKWKEVEPGKWEKKIHFQTVPLDDDKYWVSVRQSLFGQPFGKIHLPEYKKNSDLKSAVKAQILFLQRNEHKWNTDDWRIAKSAIRKHIDQVIRQYEFDEKKIFKHFESNPILSAEGTIVDKLDLLQFRKYASKRVVIDETFTKDKINNMPLSGLSKNWLANLLRSHLADFKDDPKLAFKGEALELLFRKSPFPINKVTRKESGNKIEVNNKLLEGDKGVNQYFIVEIKKVVNKTTKLAEVVRKYYTPAFLDCIERLAKGLPVHDESPDSKYLVLSPGDLVYVPHAEEAFSQIDWSDKNAISERVYIMKSSSETKCYFLPAYISGLISYYDAKTKRGEFESTNKSERVIDGSQIIKENFIKLKVDRLGNVSPT